MQSKPYTKYKTSGVEWLGDVPEHWATLPAIERLREYRTALISAAVTGKIDLREAV